MRSIPINKLRGDCVFKALHQQLAPSNFYALDGDLTLVEKYSPSAAYIVAHLEFKMGSENISFAQAICFDQYVSAPLPWRIPVYIIRAHKSFEMPNLSATELTEEYCKDALENHRFDVEKFIGADWQPEPPSVGVELVAKSINWKELIEWERELRKARREELESYIKSGWQMRKNILDPKAQMGLFVSSEV